MEGEFSKLEANLDSAIQGSRHLGEINPRDPGLHNDVIQFVKKLVRRCLSWYTQPLQLFQSSVIAASQETLRVLTSHSGLLGASSMGNLPMLAFRSFLRWNAFSRLRASNPYRCDNGHRNLQVEMITDPVRCNPAKPLR